MIQILDTNVLSEMMRPTPAPAVAAWIAARPPEELFTASVCQGEILSGIAVLPEGRRRLELEAAAAAMFLDDFDGRVLPFDTRAAVAYAGIFAACRRFGRPVATIDLMIAATARARNATVVTRNVGDFIASGITVVDPWRG